MKKIITLILTILAYVITCNINYCKAQAEQKTSPQSKSYVKIKTMKIVNGDTIVSEKEYSGEGDMQIEMGDSILGNNFNDFRFNMFNNFNDSSFFNRFYDMPDLFKNYRIPEFPDMIKNFEIDSILKNFDFNNKNLYSPRMDAEREMLKSFLYNDMINSLDSSEFYKPKKDIPKYEKNNPEDIHFQNKNIIIHDTPLKSVKDISNELQITVFPNPADSYFNVSFELDPKNKTIITISNENGKQVQKEVIDKTEGVYTRQFDMKNYSNGIYFMNIKQGKKTVSKGIIIS